MADLCVGFWTVDSGGRRGWRYSTTTTIFLFYFVLGFFGRAMRYSDFDPDFDFFLGGGTFVRGKKITICLVNFFFSISRFSFSFLCDCTLALGEKFWTGIGLGNIYPEEVRAAGEIGMNGDGYVDVGMLIHGERWT